MNRLKNTRCDSMGNEATQVKSETFYSHKFVNISFLNDYCEINEENVRHYELGFLSINKLFPLVETPREAVKIARKA